MTDDRELDSWRMDFERGVEPAEIVSEKTLVNAVRDFFFL